MAKEIKFTNAAWTFYNAQTDAVRREFDKRLLALSDLGRLELPDEMNVRIASAEVVGAMDVIRQRHAEGMKNDAAYRRSYGRIVARQELAAHSESSTPSTPLHG